ncbi:hypothetical protein [Nannocystis bainbridge]|uniref:Uncharacterized protein n=1 Tax=Nannocystis bainbridge TaxID=2995303 RepID=A0ABT5E262_9BACT|nr:hypothetical protein [Nannocystis bainbridge]MDC0719933.1 hypothetical protein [Nannocystis bainbridge]
MKLDPGSMLLEACPERFESFFPTEDIAFDSQLTALLEVAGGQDAFATIGQELLARAGALAWRDAQALINRAKATVLGDIPQDWMPAVAWMQQSGVDRIARGLWAAVAFPSSENTTALVDAAIGVGLDMATRALGAVPIVGIIAQAAVAFGRALFRAWTDKDVTPAERRYQLPWARYMRGNDEEIVQKFLIDIYGERVDWTPIWAPPTEVDVPWVLADGVDQGKVIGKMFAPLKKGEVAWNGSGLGAVPNTLRVVGLIQSRPAPPHAPKLLRFWNHGGVMQWGPSLTQTGDFRPAQSQASGQLWQQAAAVGNPDMYKIDAKSLETSWKDWFDGFFASVWKLAEGDEWLGDLAAPYIVSERFGQLRLGMSWRARPQPAPLVWPGIVTEGPARPSARNICLWAEEDVPKDIRAGESSDTFWWPWRSEPEQTLIGQDYKIVDGHLASSGPVRLPNQLPKGWRCHGWPSGEELLTPYHWPYESIVGPALAHLRKLQRECLFRTFVAAYVRPLDLPGRPRHGAFKDKDLQARCIEARAALLKSPQRFLVSYTDAKLADPEYAELLAAAGVPTTEVARQAALRQFAAKGGAGGAIDPNPAPLPPPLAPQGGVAFGADEPGGVEPNQPGPGPGGKGSGGSGGSGGGSGRSGAAGLLVAAPLAMMVLNKMAARRKGG